MIDPSQDPTYLSFQRALGFQDDEARNLVANRKAALLRQRMYQIPQLAAQLAENTKGVQDNYLARGLSTSGHKTVDLGKAEAAGALQAGAAQNDYTTQLSGLDSDLARSLAENQRKLAEEGLTARDRLAQQYAQVSPISGPRIGGGVGAPRPAAAPYNTNSNVSVDSQEYNLRDPREIKALQMQLGLNPDGMYGPKTDAALKSKNAVWFNDRPINQRTQPATYDPASYYYR